MKFTVEVEEFWIEEGELSEELKRDVMRNVIQSISKSIEEKVEKQIEIKVKDAIEEKLNPLIDNKLTDLFATGTIIYNRAEMPIKDVIEKIFNQSTGWSQPKDQVAKIAKKFGEEMKAQYNAVFANNIVQGMKEQGLLKDDVVQMLLSGE